nr:immunoglobulin-like domain-containing protein [Gemella cuniculi]
MADKDKNVITEDKVTFRLCDACLGVNLKTLIPKLKKKAPNAEFIIGCQSYCGPGRTQTFTLVNSRICIADTEVELMPLVDEKLRDRMSAEDEEKYRKRLERRLERTFYFIVPENVTVNIGEDVAIDKEGVIARKAGKSYLDMLTIESNFNKNIPGTYEVVYKVDIDGKEHKRTRTIVVKNESE